MTLPETSDEMRKLEAQINELERQKLQVQMMDIYKATALDLHSLCCQYKMNNECLQNCNWREEIKDGVHDWERKTHYHYLSRAKSLINSGINMSVIKRLKEIGFRIIVV